MTNIKSLLRQLMPLAFIAGFAGGWTAAVFLRSAHAAQGGATDGCSGKDCAVASMQSSGPLSGADITANGAFRSTAGSLTAAMSIHPDSYLFLASNRENLGSPSHFLKSNGDNLTIDASSAGGSIFLQAPNVGMFMNDSQLTLAGARPGSGNGAKGMNNTGDGEPLYVDDDQGLNIYPTQALKTCVDKDSNHGDNNSAPEGTIMTDAAAGGTSGHATRICVCTSDGAGTPTFKWRNLASGTLGTASTCAD